MSPILDNLIVAVVVVICALYAGYALSPLKAKRWVLSKLSRVVGIRVVARLAPKQCGCDDCPTTEVHSRLKLKATQEQLRH